MKIIWSRNADRHLRHAHDHIAADNPEAAAQITERILDSVEKLVQFPHVGRPGRVPHSRELVVTDTPFFLPYRVRDDRTEILAVIQEARKWPAG